MSALHDRPASVARSPSAEDRDRRWNAPLAPMSLAAYVTWIAVAIGPLSDFAAGRLPVGGRELAGIAGLCFFLLLFVTRSLLGARTGKRESVPQGLVLLQVPCVLLAIWMLPKSGSVPVLLVILAAQLAAVFEAVVFLPILIATNAVFGALLVFCWGYANAWPAWFAYVGFEIFATLTTTYARRAEAARDALAQINAELMATRHLLLESARGEERLRLSRELHDVAGHKLTALKLQLRVLGRAASDEARAGIAQCVQLSDELLADVRGVVDTLRAHDGIDLHAALTALVPALPQPRITLELAAGARVASIEQAQALLRCAQEGLTNALRHSDAANVVLRLVHGQDAVELQIEDDGGALAIPEFGNGLRGMRERLSAFGGTLGLALVSGGGLKLCARLPAGTATA